MIPTDIVKHCVLIFLCFIVLLYLSSLSSKIFMTSEYKLCASFSWLVVSTSIVTSNSLKYNETLILFDAIEKKLDKKSELFHNIF